MTRKQILILLYRLLKNYDELKEKLENSKVIVLNNKVEKNKSKYMLMQILNNRIYNLSSREIERSKNEKYNYLF